MAEKAVLVTGTNLGILRKRFDDGEETGVPIAVGYYLVAGFGEHLGYEMLSAANFNALYSKGPQLRNGFFEAVKKVTNE